MTPSPWDKRVARAAELEQSHPPAAELLHFYRHLAEFQKSVAQACWPVSLAAEVAQASWPVSLACQVEPLLTLVARLAPAPLAQSAATLLRDPAEWDRLLLSPADSAEAFFSRVLQQPYREALAHGRPRNGPGNSDVPRTAVQPVCPFCGEDPVVSILRPEGDGGKRSLICSLCFTEWDFRRLLCPHCGEEDKDKLAIYSAAEFPHIRVEVCDTCRTYLKSIDLTRNGLAVPEVDELASVSLDLWAAEQGYTKLQPNLFGL